MSTTTSERWGYFQECVCFDMQKQELCLQASGASPFGESFGFVLLDQCTPYLRFLVVQLIYFILGAIGAFIAFIVFLLMRFACDLCGGRKPSIGVFRPSTTKRFGGYSRRTIHTFLIVATLTLTANLAATLACEIPNISITNSVSAMATSVHDFVGQASGAMTAVTPFLDQLDSVVGSNWIAVIKSNFRVVESYLGKVNTALTVVHEVNGEGFQFGRSQVVLLCTFVPLSFMVLALLLGWLDITCRGVLHAALGFIIAVLTFAIIAMSMVHAMAYYVLSDTCRYVSELNSDARAAVTSTCGLAREQSYGFAMTQLQSAAVERLCDDNINALCSNYFSCVPNVCSSSSSEWTLDALGTTLESARLLVNAANGTQVPSDHSLVSCLMTHGCFGYPAAAIAANETAMKAYIVGRTYTKLNVTVWPYVRCTLGETVLDELTHRTCSIADSSATIAWSAAGYFALAYLMAVQFVVGGKRFSRRNEVERVARRRARREGINHDDDKEQPATLGASDTDESATTAFPSDSPTTTVESGPSPSGAAGATAAATVEGVVVVRANRDEDDLSNPFLSRTPPPSARTDTKNKREVKPRSPSPFRM